MILRPVSDKSAKSDEKSKKDLTRGHIITASVLVDDLMSVSILQYKPVEVVGCALIVDLIIV